jgi:hypothetical protein
MSEYDELLDWLRRESEAVINNWPPNVTRVGPTEPGNIFEDAAAAIRKLTAERDEAQAVPASVSVKRE